MIVKRKTTQVGKVPKEFLFVKGEISKDKSKAIWNSLYDNKFIEANGCFTERYTPNIPSFSLNLSKRILQNPRFQLTEAYIIDQLTPLYKQYAANQIDLMTVLKKEA
jgi:hypothetical protein